MNPSSENLARHIWRGMAELLATHDDPQAGKCGFTASQCLKKPRKAPPTWKWTTDSGTRMGMDAGAPQEYGPLTPKTDGTSMTKALCLLHANCRAMPCGPLLENTPAFASRFNIRQYVNYTRQSIADSDIERCELFLYQRLAPQVGRPFHRTDAVAPAAALPVH